jgi:hypothetical protein
VTGTVSVLSYETTVTYDAREQAETLCDCVFTPIGPLVFYRAFYAMY